MRLIARHGFAAVSMRQIAAEVGGQAGALYNYVADKQTLLFQLMNGHMEHLLGELKGSDCADDPTQRLEDFARFHIRYHLDRPELVFVAYMELRNLTEPNFVRIEALRRTYEDHLEGILVQGQKSGAFQMNDSKVTTMAIIAMLTGITTWFQETGRLGRDEIEEIYRDLVFRSVDVRRN